MYCSDNEDSSCSETRRKHCETKKRICEKKKNPYDVIKKRPLHCENKKKTANGESKFESWKEMYKENKFTMDTILCIICFGSAIIFSRYINPDILNK